MSSLADRLIRENKSTGSSFLDLGNCGLTILPDELFKLYWIKELNIGGWYYNKEKKIRVESKNRESDNRINKLSLQKLNQLSSLLHLYISDNQISDISFLHLLTELQTLNLSNNKISDISFLQSLEKLNNLDLSSNKISDISSLHHLMELRDLDLSDNQISDISFLQPLIQLRSLYLSNNQISDIKTLQSLRKLQNLYLGTNNIINISCLQFLRQLKSLNLGSNQISDISFLEPLTQLQNLYLSSNNINDVSFLRSLIKLQSLFLSGNQISDISFLQSLTEMLNLNLSSNKITNISFLQPLTKLQSLFLGHNQISDISFLQSLTQLQSLYLSSNNISDISFLQSLTQLETLNLINNQIKKIPEDSLEGWPKLFSLSLSDNPIENIPKDILDGYFFEFLQKLRDYFASLKKGKTENCEVKLILVGNTTAGKSSLTRFIHERIYDNIQNSTHGIQLKRWLVPDTNPTLQVNIWDFGGQEYYHATHRLFLNDQAVYLVVWEANTNLQGIQETSIYFRDQKQYLLLEHFHYRYWLESIRYFAPQSTILIVQTKTDIVQTNNKKGALSVPPEYFERPYNVQEPAYQLSVVDAFTHIEDYNTNYWLQFKSFEANLIKTLHDEALKYPLGIKWIQIRDYIRQKLPAQYWMTYNDFGTFCRSIDPTVELKGLMTYLGGSASTILYYENDIHLSNIVFLNPQWVTETIYDILNYDIQENNGEFNRTHVEKILSKKGIEKMTDIFLELMKTDRFELIFEKLNCLDIYIAPQYLPNVYSDHKSLNKLRPKSPLGFTLYFPVYMPKSVFLQFIARYGNLAEDIYWKYGIVLDKKEVRIIAECLFSDRKIKIDIEDKPAAQQLAEEIFNVLWGLSDKKNGIEVSINGVDFVEINELKDCLRQVTQIKSKQGNWIPVNDFNFLFSENKKKLERLPIADPDFIDNSPDIFFSYAWGDEHETGESREKIVNDLYEDLMNSGYNIFRDKMNLGYKGLISGFMNRIGKGDIIIVALSDKYLKSPYCMFELSEIYRNARQDKAEFVKRIFPIRVENIGLNKPTVQKNYFDYWNTIEKEWDFLIEGHRKQITTPQFNEYKKVQRIHNELGDLLIYLSDMNALTKELLSENNFAEIKKAIQAHVHRSVE